MTVDLERRQECHVEIARGEAEGLALVALDDHGDVAGAQLFLRPPQAARPMVVSSHRERPGAEQVIVVQHQIG
ncbi:MAG: hypothetical protein ACYDBZ_20715, partial [Steroidobacteraceae bacterium]